MNLAGKILAVLIAVLSIVFMTASMALYATHKNWRDEVLWPKDKATSSRPMGFKFSLEYEKSRNEELTAQLKSLTDEKEQELAAKNAALTKLENENVQLQKEIEQRQQQQAEIVASEREAVASLDTTQKESSKLREENVGLRTDVAQAQKDRDSHFKEVVRLTDEMNQLQNEITQMKNRSLTLAADLAKARDVLRHFDKDVDTDISATPPNVDGLVVATPDNTLVEINLGSDAGLQKGHRLDVYRVGAGGNKYLGRIEVLKTAVDKSVCRIDPKFLQAPIMKGDRVASKLD